MGRVLSPNDVFYNYDPWRSLVAWESQNPIINDPPTSWYPLMSLLQSEPEAFHWNRYVGSGIPGYGALAAAVLSPLIALPVLLLPLWLVYTGIILLKMGVPYLGTYLWLRQSRIGKPGAAIGASVFALSGIYSVWWLWQATSATALYPWALLMIRRLFDGSRVPFVAWWTLGVFFLLSGFPAPIVYFAYAAGAYALWLAIRFRRLPVRRFAVMLLALVLAVTTLAPPLISFTRFLQRTGYLEQRREAAATAAHYPTEHLAGFISPFRLGDPIEQTWRGPRSQSSNFIEMTVYLGLITLLLMAAGLLRRGHSERWFWASFLAVLTVALFFSGGVGSMFSSLPGIGYSALTRLRVLLPIAAAFLAAQGAALLLSQVSKTSVRSVAGTGIALLVTFDLALFAAYFYPYVPLKIARLPSSPTIEWLSGRTPPFRILPTFDMLWPNSAELARLEDVRSHFGSEARYRRLIQRVDPSSWGGSGTVLQVNGLLFDVTDPVLGLLNVRYITEQPSIDVLRWRIIEKTRPSGIASGAFPIEAGTRLRRDIGIPPEDAWAVELAVRVEKGHSSSSQFTVELRRPFDGTLVRRVSRSAEQLRRNEKVYVPLPRTGEPLHLEVIASQLDASLPAAEDAAGWAFGWVSSPLVLREVLPDGRIFELLSRNERYHAVWNVRRDTFEAMLADRSIDFSRLAVVEPGAPLKWMDEIAGVPGPLRRVTFRLLEWTPRSERLEIRSAVPSLIVASEKLVPELEVRLNGERMAPVPVNGLFWAVPVPAGSHLLEVSRTTGKGWWPVSGVSILLVAIAVVLDRRRMLQPE